MKTYKQILEAYKKADRIRRDNMWCRFIALRGEFDDIERFGTAWETEASPLHRQSTGMRDSLAPSPPPEKEESLVNDDPVKRHSRRVEYTDKQLERFYEVGQRTQMMTVSFPNRLRKS